MEIPDAFWDWDFRRQRAWFFATLPGAPYDQINAAHGEAIASGLDVPREICSLSADGRETFLNWYSQVHAATSASTGGASVYEPFNYPADRQQEAVAIGAACQLGILQTRSDPSMMRQFADDARAFGGNASLNAWAQSHPWSTNAEAEGYLAGRALGGTSAAAYVYPAGQVATRRLHAPVRRTRRRPRLAVNRLASGRVTVLPVIHVQTQTHALPQDQPPLPGPGYVPPPVPPESIFGPPIVLGGYPTPQPPIPSSPPQTHSIPEPSVPGPGVSPWVIVGGLAAVTAAGYMIFRASQSAQASRRASDRSPLGWAQRQASLRSRHSSPRNPDRSLNGAPGR